MCLLKTGNCTFRIKVTKIFSSTYSRKNYSTKKLTLNLMRCLPLRETILMIQLFWRFTNVDAVLCKLNYDLM